MYFTESWIIEQWSYFVWPGTWLDPVTVSYDTSAWIGVVVYDLSELKTM